MDIRLLDYALIGTNTMVPMITVIRPASTGTEVRFTTSNGEILPIPDVATITPETGDFFIFPALLQHWVVPYKTKCTRVSVSGNLTIINKNELPQGYF